MTTEESRWAYLIDLDEQLLVGGVVLSEWCAFITREADSAYAKGAFLGAILTACCAIETHLRGESATERSKAGFAEMINGSDLDQTIIAELHALRRFRNKWVHVNEPWEDRYLLASPETATDEIEAFAGVAMRLMRLTLYDNPWL